MKIKLFSSVALIATLFLTSTLSAGTWTYRNMFEARKACAEYYFATYTAQMDAGTLQPWMRTEDVLSFWTSARQTAADMKEFADVLDTPYTKPTWDPSVSDNFIPPGVVFPYSNAAVIPYFGADFPYAIPGYSTIPPSVKTAMATSPTTRTVTLYAYNGFPLSSQITPDHYYVYSLAGSPKTLTDCKLANWYPTSAEAIAAGSPAVVPPPFGEKVQPQGNLQLFACQGIVNPDGTLKLDSWRIVPVPSSGN